MKTHKIAVQNIPGFSFTTNEGETLLQASERQGISFPVGCENGLCGTCKGELITGKTSYGSQEIYGLTPEEMDQGQILFCSAIPEGDCMVKNAGIEIPPQHYDQTAKVIERRVLSAHLTELVLETQTPWIYKAGQYLNLVVDAPEKVSLPFSIANAPGTTHLKLHIQILETQQNRPLLETLLQAPELHIEGPHGKAYLRSSSRPLLLLAGGSGFAPFASILETLIQTNSPREIFLYWGARKPEFLYEHERLLTLEKNHPKFHYLPVISEPSDTDWNGKTGLVHEAVLQDHENLTAFECYMAGPYAMVKAAQETFIHKGLSPRLMYSDMA